MKHNLRMGAAPAVAPAPKFWNMASLNNDEGEITLYGDVLSKQYYDWWTGEPEPGLYITPEGFMEDLALVKDKSKITVKLNSCGGDLYTGIAIHNALKALPGEVNVIIEGIAASAASVIACAGDTVTVYPGSLVMIHGVSIMSWEWMNIQDMEQLMNSMDASERAVAAIYNAKTGIDVETLRSMMKDETWMTGEEAVEKGFADVLSDAGNSAAMSLSADRKVLMVNGINHNVEGLRNFPGSIPIKNATPPAKNKKQGVNKTAKAAENKGGNKKMALTLEELRSEHPELVEQIENSAREAVQAQMAADVAAERARIADIDAIAASIPDQQMVHDAKYGETPCTAQELCFRVMKQSAASGQQFLANYAADGAASGAADVNAAPNNGLPESQEEQDATDIMAVVNAYKQTTK